VDELADNSDDEKQNKHVCAAEEAKDG